jgi:imidazolonepropionase-like amidohydrolase
MRRPALSLMAALFFLSCATAPAKVADESAAAEKEPFAAYQDPVRAGDAPARPVAEAVLLRGGTVMTAAGEVLERGHVLLQEGKIKSVGAGEGKAPPGAIVVDVSGRFITPGIIDTHSHLGVYASPSVEAHADGNEMTRPVTAEVSAEDGFWPQDPGLWRALSGGVTTIQVLPGSANLIGGRSFLAKLRPDVSARLMRFPGAPEGVKFACGENPKRVYGKKGSFPSTRMGSVAGFRQAFQEAYEYKRRWDKYDRDLALWSARRAGGASPDKSDKPDDPPEPPGRNHKNDTLKAVLEGKTLVHNHCYRADEMSIMLDLAKEYGFQIRSFHHALEAYKMRHRLAEEGVAVSTWADWWGFKLEAFDGIPQNLAMLQDAGVRTIVHSDSSTDIRHLNQEAAKGRTAGRKIGIEVSDDELLRWLTANPAWALGIDDQVGTLEPGKMADVVVWDRSPFSVYARAAQVYIDGELVYDRNHQVQPTSDFELGLLEDMPAEGVEVIR